MATTTNGADRTVLRLQPPGLEFEEDYLACPESFELVATPESRFATRRQGLPDVAELFHENSKTTAFELGGRGDALDRVAQAREWYLDNQRRLSERYTDERSRLPLDALPPATAAVVGSFARSAEAGKLLYALNLCILIGERVYRLVPGGDALVWEGRVTAAPPRVHRSVVGWLSTVPEGVLFVVGVPWRYMRFLGPRGYRLMLMDAGALVGVIDRLAEDVGCTATAATDFCDIALDGQLELDGVERSVLAVIRIDEEADDEPHVH